MTDTPPQAAQPVRLHLAAGLDRSIAWRGGGSVRYLVAELSAHSVRSPDASASRPAPPLNLALAIDISGSMAGAKLEAALRAALEVAEALTPKDRLSIVTFDHATEQLLDARTMDQAGRAAARQSLLGLRTGGQTNLFDGWLLAAERVAIAMEAAPQASHRVLLLSDGHANHGLTDRGEIAGHTGALLERGVVTSTLGVGDGYDEALLGAMAEAGGGNLHDAGVAGEIGELIQGELQHGRATLAERVTLRVTVPATVRAEIVGIWAHALSGAALHVTVGSLLPDQIKRVVLRLHCPPGEAGDRLSLPVSADGGRTDGGFIEASPVEVDLRFARGSENHAQPRDAERVLAVVQAWQAQVLREAVRMNRGGDRRTAKHFLERELRWMEPYARGFPAAEALVAELVLVHRRVGEAWEERTRKELYAASFLRSRSESDPRATPRQTILERFSPPPPGR